MFQARVNVTLKKSVLDPQGKTILNALHSLGFEGTKNVRVGKFFELQLEDDTQAAAEEKLRAMCDKLLINPVIEEYSYSVEEAKA